MANHNDYTEITPVDLKNPFRNPTEEPDYSPDYRQIAPELDMPDSSLPLFPSHNERSNIRKFYTLTFLSLLFGLLTAMTIFVALQMIATTAIQQVDLRQLGELPGNYAGIIRQYLNDSSIPFAINLISFLVGNTFAFAVGCKLTGLDVREFFRLRELTAARTVCYVLIGLWLQLLTSMLGEKLLLLFERAGLSLMTPDFSLNSDWKRTAMVALYAGLIAPVTEELLMRGLLLKNLSRVSQRFAILFSAFLFGIMHENLIQFLYTFPLGILLGYITVKHNSVTPAIIVHIITNCASVAIALCNQLLTQSTFRIVNMVYILAVLLFGTVSLLYLLFSERLPDQTPHQSLRSFRIAASSPLLWLLIGVHIVAGWLAAH